MMPVHGNQPQILQHLFGKGIAGQLLFPKKGGLLSWNTVAHGQGVQPRVVVADEQVGGGTLQPFHMMNPQGKQRMKNDVGQAPGNGVDDGFPRLTACHALRHADASFAHFTRVSTTSSKVREVESSMRASTAGRRGSTARRISWSSRFFSSASTSS